MPTPAFVISRAPAFMARSVPVAAAGIVVRPAGQATGTCPSSATHTDFMGNCLDASGNILDINGGHWSTSGLTKATGAPNQTFSSGANNNALYNAVGSAL